MHFNIELTRIPSIEDRNGTAHLTTHSFPFYCLTKSCAAPELALKNILLTDFLRLINRISLPFVITESDNGMSNIVANEELDLSGTASIRLATYTRTA